MNVGEHELNEPLSPVHPFNQPGEPVVLHDGELHIVHGESPIHGVGNVELRCHAGLDVRWHVDELPRPLVFSRVDTLELLLISNHGERRITAHHSGAGAGWINEARWDTGEPIERGLLHWMNLPAIRGNRWLGVRHDDGDRQWNGRWEGDVAGWHLTLDRRPDHQEVWRALQERPAVAMTHVMEVTRRGRLPFSSGELDDLCTALQFAFSFALGHWVAPALPIGLTGTGRRGCEQWAALHCDPKVNSGAAWWSHDADDIVQLLERLLIFCRDPAIERAARILIGISIQGAHAGFLEQRIMTLFSGLEHLAWIRLRQAQRLSSKDYDRKRAGGRLSLLLADAGIADNLATYQLPSLDAFAASEELESVAHVLARVRNRIVHPKDPSVYEIPDLLTDTWLLTRYYFVLLLLHWIGYRGSVAPIWRRNRWQGETETAPWA